MFILVANDNLAILDTATVHKVKRVDAPSDHNLKGGR